MDDIARFKRMKLNKPFRINDKKKKFAVYVNVNGKIKKIKFGAKGYRANYSKKAFNSYRSRARGIKDKYGNLTYKNKASPNYWSYHYGWSSKKWKSK